MDHMCVCTKSLWRSTSSQHVVSFCICYFWLVYPPEQGCCIASVIAKPNQKDRKIAECRQHTNIFVNLLTVKRGSQASIQFNLTNGTTTTTTAPLESHPPKKQWNSNVERCMLDLGLTAFQIKRKSLDSEGNRAKDEEEVVRRRCEARKVLYCM